jgi:hypothetical protein
MASSSGTAILEPLDKSKAEIRLLHLQPSLDREEVISCTLYFGDLDDRACEYHALSYEWGDPTSISRNILINGENITIRENLWWALWHLRDQMTEIVLWVDALCINQDNLEERNHQVCSRLLQRVVVQFLVSRTILIMCPRCLKWVEYFTGPLAW